MLAPPLGARSSRGTHLVELASLRPRLLGAHLHVLRLLAQRAAPPGALVACGCDVHALPAWHARHAPLGTMVSGLHDALLADTASRRGPLGSRAEHFSLTQLRAWNARVKQTDMCLRRFAKERRRPLLAACALLVDTLPATDSLVGARLHAGPPDLAEWAARGGERFFRPAGLREGEHWLIDSSMWLPDRLCAYNASLLAAELQRLRAVDGSLVDSARTWSAVVCVSRLGAVRSNDGARALLAGCGGVGLVQCRLCARTQARARSPLPAAPPMDPHAALCRAPLPRPRARPRVPFARPP